MLKATGLAIKQVPEKPFHKVSKKKVVGLKKAWIDTCHLGHSADKAAASGPYVFWYDACMYKHAYFQMCVCDSVLDCT